MIAVSAAGCSVARVPTSGATAISASTSQAPTPTPATSSPKPVARSPQPTATRSAQPLDTAHLALGHMSEAERIGQLLMMGVSSTQINQSALSLISQYHVGSVVLDGASYLSVAQTARLTSRLQQASGHLRLFIATDQEGGKVLRLRGAGFTHVPSALEQGTVAPSQLRRDTARWAGQLKAAGVNMDLGPVLDTVPFNFGPNPPIGDFDREYGHSTLRVTSHGTAVAQGLADVGVAATIKHFPGLGRVSGNTDLTSGVTDLVTTRHDQYLAPFSAAIKAGAPLVMMSTAIYGQIDGVHPAVFSRAIVTDMLRGDLSFSGVIISDDLGVAAQVRAYSPGERAVKFIAAGGDIVLTVDAGQIPAMASALLHQATIDPAFKSKVDAAALVVLQAKHKFGLL